MHISEFLCNKEQGEVVLIMRNSWNYSIY